MFTRIPLILQNVSKCICMHGLHTSRHMHMHMCTHRDMGVHNIHTMLELSCDLGLWRQRMQPLVSVAAAVAASTAAMLLASSAPVSTTFVQCPCCQD